MKGEAGGLVRGGGSGALWGIGVGMGGWVDGFFFLGVRAEERFMRGGRDGGGDEFMRL